MNGSLIQCPTRHQTAGEHSGAFSSSRARCFHLENGELMYANVCKRDTAHHMNIKGIIYLFYVNKTQVIFTMDQIMIIS